MTREFDMKYLYWLLGIVVVAGVGYVSYLYGSGAITLANNAMDNLVNNSTTNTTNPNQNLTPWNEVIPSYPTTDMPTNIGTKAVAITSPKNGEIIQIVPVAPEHNSFSLTGTVSPNANKIRVEVYSKGSWDGMGGVATEKRTDDYFLTKFKLGDKTWSYKVTAGANGNLEGDSARFIVTAYYTDGTTKTAETRVTYSYETAELGKPVIYLYPETTQQVSVNVRPTSGISYSEPVIGNGWQVTANPDGTLIDSLGKSWPYLFWEGFAANFVTPKEGFVVARNEVSKFFDTKLAILGMNAKEIADFKEFWMPRMQDKPYYFVTFIPQAMFDSYAPLTVNPLPDTVIRVFFDYKGLDAPMSVPTQILPKTPERIGFTVVEWGGRIYR